MIDMVLSHGVHQLPWVYPVKPIALSGQRELDGASYILSAEVWEPDAVIPNADATTVAGLNNTTEQVLLTVPFELQTFVDEPIRLFKGTALVSARVGVSVSAATATARVRCSFQLQFKTKEATTWNNLTDEVFSNAQDVAATSETLFSFFQRLSLPEGRLVEQLRLVVKVWGYRASGTTETYSVSLKHRRGNPSDVQLILPAITLL